MEKLEVALKLHFCCCNGNKFHIEKLEIALKWGYFVSDYERAQAEGDNRYKDIAQLYEKVKEKLHNG